MINCGLPTEGGERGRTANRTQWWGRGGGQSLSLLQGPVDQKARCKAKQPCISSLIPAILLLLRTQEIAGIDKQQALIALGRFKSCVRTSLLLCDGYECQEKEGTFLVAFSSPRAAVEWALTLQLALMRYSQKLPWYAATCHALLSYVTFYSSCAMLGLPAIPVSRYAVPRYAVPLYTTDSMLDHPILCCAEPFAMLCHTTTPPLQCTILYEFMPSCAMLPHAMLRHVMLCCAVSGHAVQLQCVILFSAMLCYAMLCYAMLYAVWCNAMPWGVQGALG